MNIENDIYKNKYLKYKTKYAELKKNEEHNDINDYEYINEGGKPTINKIAADKLKKTAVDKLKKTAHGKIDKNLKKMGAKMGSEIVDEMGENNENNECDCCDKCPKKGCTIS